ncbi:MAG TPA: YceD family protein [Ramlibacter sp.]|uniref:YceD family protein n=1 Tax=Ramlibacter sp. TaxID=1917967 RepID=UPI002ED1DAA4
MAKDFDPRRLDVRRFAEEGGQLDASDALGTYPRLVKETVETERRAREVRWHARGEILNPRHVQPEVWVHVEADASVPLVCQRCLQAVDVPLSVDRSFRFVADEATAAAEDDEAEEDLLALSRSFDLVELVEDELLMELPLSPRHDVCPEAVKMSAEDPGFEAAGAEKVHPFAVLGRLKTGK